jgi:serine/threonine protein kinase
MLAEVEIHRSLMHEHVLRFYSAFETDDHVYLLLEVARHGTLQDIMEARKRLTEPECQYYLPQLLDGLAYLAEAGVVHRDLTLNNLFVGSDGAHPAPPIPPQGSPKRRAGCSAARAMKPPTLRCILAAR